MHHFYTHLAEYAALFSTVKLLAKAMLWLGFFSLLLVWMRRWRQPAEHIPTASVQKKLPAPPVLSFIPQASFLLALLTINVWLADPVIPVVNETRTIETRDIFVAVDKSGSMDTIITDAQGNGEGRRIEAAAQACNFFVSRRQGDRVGLAVFDDNTYMHWPMTDDLSIILTKTALIPNHVSGGTNIEGPTGPIQTVIEHWKEYGKATTKVLILVSDGDAPLSEERIAKLTEEMSALGGKLYLLGVGETWSAADKADADKTAPLRKLVDNLGGKVFAVADAQQMLDAVAAIDQLEKSNVKVETSETFSNISHYFGLASCIFMFLFIASVALTRERV